MNNDNYIISDIGLQKTHDKFGKLVIVCCVIMIAILIFWGVMAIIV